MADVAMEARRNGLANPYALLAGDFDAADLLAADEIVSPLRRHDCPPVTDGAAALVLGAVLILFIIIPKMSDDVEKQLQELDQLKAVKVQVARMDSLMLKLKKKRVARSV